MEKNQALSTRAPRIRKKYLPLLAGVVWSIAGTALLSIGLPALLSNIMQMPVISVAGVAVVFFLFFLLIFRRLFRKHTARIDAFQVEKVCAFAFFDVKGYIIMACMITFGILLRMSGILPQIVLGVLYTGIGLSMLGAAISFLVTFFQRHTKEKAA